MRRRERGDAWAGYDRWKTDCPPEDFEDFDQRTPDEIEADEELELKRQRHVLDNLLKWHNNKEEH